ncbi:MAG: hypothetical protein KGI71_02305 [Patescibacteria group bacterium]|nr:hypothetical protein [Patescibacteria group bacterium]
MKGMRDQFSAGSFLAGLVLGGLLVDGWFLGGNAFFTSPSPSPTQNIATSTSPAQTQSGALSVADQPAGDTVTIESVTVPPPGVWVAVREMHGTDLGNVLGAELVHGPRSNFTVSLLRGTEAGHKYAVELYRDDANGTFDLSQDSVYIDFDTGASVIAYFTTVE